MWWFLDFNYTDPPLSWTEARGRMLIFVVVGAIFFPIFLLELGLVKYFGIEEHVGDYLGFLIAMALAITQAPKLSYQVFPEVIGNAKKAYNQRRGSATG